MLVFAVVLLVASVLGVTLLMRVRGEIIARQDQDRVALAMSAAGFVAETVGQSVIQQQNFVARNRGELLAADQRQATELLRMLTQESTLLSSEAMLIRGGEVMASWPENPEVIGSDLSGYEHIRLAMQAREPAVSGAVESAIFSGQPIVGIASPVVNQAGEVEAVLAAGALAEEGILARYLARIDAGVSGFAFLVDQEGRPISHPEAEELGLASLKETNPGVALALKGDPGVGRYRNAEGIETVGAFAPIAAPAGWAVIVRQDLEEYERTVAGGVGRTLAFVIFLVLLTAAAGLVAIRLYQTAARHAREIQERERRIAAIHQVTRALTRSTSTVEILDQVFAEAQELFNADVVLVALQQDEGDAVKGFAATGIDERVWKEFAFGAGDKRSSGAEAMRTQEIVEVNDFAVSRFSEGPLSKEIGMVAAITAPLVFDGVSQGVLTFGYLHDTKSFSSEELMDARGLADEAALALARSRYLERLEKLDQEKDEFVSMVSHELRGPLTVIKGWISMILEGALGDLEEKQREYLTISQNNVERLFTLVEDLLTVSRAESGHLDIIPEELSLGRLVEEMATGIAAIAQEREITLNVQVDPDLPRIQADPMRIEQVIANLISNALKFTPPGETVSIRIGAKDGGVITEISDTGAGIPASDQDRLFQKFFRSSSGRGKIPGTGLGLAISKAIAEGHGGRVGFTSVEGEGSTFWLWLPGPDSQGQENPVDSDMQPSEGEPANE